MLVPTLYVGTHAQTLQRLLMKLLKTEADIWLPKQEIQFLESG